MVCVEYLGVVCDVVKMLLILGGEEGVFWIYVDFIKRLELYFWFKDLYCYLVCVNCFSISSLLFCIRKRMRWQKGVLGIEVYFEVIFDMEIFGIIFIIYKFQGMFDFQYLVVYMEVGGKYMLMYDKVFMFWFEKEVFFYQELLFYIFLFIFFWLDVLVDYFY